MRVFQKMTKMNRLGPMQAKFLKEADGFFNLAKGGIRSGKTAVCTTKFMLDIRKYPPQWDVAIVGVTRDAIMRNVVRPVMTPFYGDRMQEKLGEQRIVLPDGRSCHIIGAQDVASQHKIAGMTLAAVMFDEITRIHPEAFSQTMNRLSHPGAKAFGTTNTGSPGHWFKRLYLDPLEDPDFLDEEGNPPMDIKSFHFRITDNPSNDDRYIRETEARLKAEGEARWRRDWLGEWVDPDDAIYNLADVFGRPPDHKPKDVAIGVDWGTNHPTVFLRLERLPNGNSSPIVWVTDELVLNDNNQRLPPHKIVDRFKEWVVPPGQPSWMFNPATLPRIHLDPSAAPLDSAMRYEGIFPWVAPDGQKSRVVDHGIGLVARNFGLGKLKVSNKCKFLADNLHSYVWDEKAAERGDQKPLKKNDDAADALRYAVTANAALWF